MASSKELSWYGVEVGEAEKRLVDQVIDSNYLNEGEVTRTFEARLAAYLGVRHALTTTSGTAAIAVALMALGIGHGDVVLVPDLTFIATANAARLAGAEVRLVDVDPERLLIDPEAVRRRLCPRTRAVVAVEVNGRCPDYEALWAICREHGLRLVSDSAEALGSSRDGRKLGTLAEIGCFSFSANKVITTGQGGMVVTDDDALALRLRELKDQGRRAQGTGGDDTHFALGFNFRMTNLQAAVGLGQFERLEERLEHTRRRDAWYAAWFAALPARLPANAPGEIAQWRDILVEDRPQLERVLAEEGVGWRNFWHPLHTQAPYREDAAAFPVSSRVSSQGLWLPSSFHLTEEAVAQVARAVARALNG